MDKPRDPKSDDDASSVDSREEDRRKRNKKHSKKRDNDDKDDHSDEDDSSRNRRHKHKKSRKKRSKRDYSSSSSSSDSEDSSEEERRRRKRRRKKKKDKKRKDKKKKHRDDDDDSSQSDNAAVFGKYGIIKAADFNRMQRSFAVWLAEVKGIPALPGSRYEQQKFFSDYCEDYNTATLPHKKYYDYEKYEMEEYEKHKALEAKQASALGTSVLADEARHKRQQQERALAKQEAERRALLSTMSREKVQEMKHQATLRAQMQSAYKSGDMATYQRIKERLEADP